MSNIRHKRMSKRFFWDSVTKEQLLDAYENQALTPEEIGLQYGVSGHTIRNAMRHFGIVMRGSSATRRKRGSAFFRLSKEELTHLYCDEALTGREIAQRFGVGQTSVLRCLAKFCIPRRISKDGHGWTWKGSKRTTNGYIEVLLEPEDAMYQMANKRGYVPEHRLVMARHLGRCLSLTEVVHHRNGIRDDNRLENLELFPSIKEHCALSRTCTNCELKKEIRLLHWQIKEQSEQIKNLTRVLSGLDGS